MKRSQNVQEMTPEQEQSSQLVSKVKRSCKCGYRDTFDFKPPIEYHPEFYYNWIDSQENKCPKCGETLLALPKDDNKTIEKELTELYHFKAMKETDELYYYDTDKGIYIKDGEWLIKQECMKLDPQMKPRIVSEIIERIKWSNFVGREQFDSQIEWIAAKNCIINLRTLETRPFSPDFMSTVRIPHDYKPMPDGYEPLLSSDGTSLRDLPSIEDWENMCKCSCPCPNIMKFLYQVIAPQDVETILDFMAYCLWRDLPFHTWLLLNGSGRNGKGVTTYLFQALLGKENVSAESLKRILENRFAAAELYRKLANIDADLSNEALKNTGQLKKLTGGDEIPAENKFKPPFHFKSHAKLIFSANQIPETPDESDAFYARLVIINFLNQYLGKKADPWLKEKLTTDEEMAGLFSLVVARVPRVLEKGIFVSHSSIEENYTKYIESSDPIRAFYEQAIRPESGNKISKDDVYDAYSNFCKYRKLNAESVGTFNRRLKKEHDISDFKGTKREDRRYYWLGIKVIDYTKPEEGQESL